jgi:hypothetical protein
VEAPFFVVGCPRSGTTLLRNLLRSHPNLTLPSESHFVPSLFAVWGDPGDARAARRLAARILRLHWVRSWELGLAPAALADCRRYRELVERLYRAYARRQGKPRWGDKTPAYALELATLDRIFPDARFIHVVRDGREVALSLMRTAFGPQNPYTAARYWRRHVVAARHDGEPLGATRYLEVRYDDLVGQTEPTLRRVCDFLGEPFDAAVLTPTPMVHSTRAKIFGPRVGRHVSDTAVVAGNTGKWRREMPAADLDLFEVVAGDALETFGYERGGRPRRLPGVLARVAWSLASRGRWAFRQLGRPHKRLWVPTDLTLRWASTRARRAPRGDRP